MGVVVSAHESAVQVEVRRGLQIPREAAAVDGQPPNKCADNRTQDFWKISVCS